MVCVHHAGLATAAAIATTMSAAFCCCGTRRGSSPQITYTESKSQQTSSGKEPRLRMEPKPERKLEPEAEPASDSPGRSLTVVVTTSYVMSHPSTALLQTVLDSFSLVPGLAECRTIVVCDGFKVTAASRDKGKGKGRGRRGANNQSKLGYVSEAGAARYRQYIRQVKRFASTRPGAIEVLVLPRHHGFAYAVKAALQRVATEFVMVVQHDYIFLRGFDLPAVLYAMQRYPELKYIGM